MVDPEGQRFGLAPLNLADRALFTPYFSRLQQPLSDYSFANIFIWRSSLKLYWARWRRHLCLFANGTELTMLMPPLPEPGAEAGDLRRCLSECFAVMDAYNDGVGAPRATARIEYVSEEILQQLMCWGISGGEFDAQPMSGDYIYDMARMIDLAGGPLKSKRHARSRFQQEFPDHRVESLTLVHVPLCLKLLDVWHGNADENHIGEITARHVATSDLRRREVAATRTALENWDALGLTGMVLWVGDRLGGFTLGEPLGAAQASILIEKTHPDFPGAAQFIFSEFCRRCWSRCGECNVGDDWDIPTLRFTKESYRPQRRLAKYVLRRRGAEVLDPALADRENRLTAARRAQTPVHLSEPYG